MIIITQPLLIIIIRLEILEVQGDYNNVKTFPFKINFKEETDKDNNKVKIFHVT